MNINNIATVTDGAMVLKTTVLNEGDDTSLNIFLEFIELNKKVRIADKLGPNESVEKTIEFSKSELGLNLSGEYYSPYRIVYDDLNHMTYSSPQLLKYVNQSSGISPISIVLKLKGKKVTLSDKISAEFTLRNTIENVANVKSLSVFSSNEVGVKLNSSKNVDLELNSGETKTYTLDLENLSGRDKSNYQVFIIARGEYKERLYATSNFFFATIDDSGESSTSSNPFFLFLFVAIAVLAAGVFFGKNSKKS